MKLRWRSARSLDIPDDLFDDFTTEVTIHARKQPVRQILTNCVPLKKYGRLLWIAESSEKNGKLATVVQYYGPKEEPEGQTKP